MYLNQKLNPRFTFALEGDIQFNHKILEPKFGKIVGTCRKCHIYNFIIFIKLKCNIYHNNEKQCMESYLRMTFVQHHSVNKVC